MLLNEKAKRKILITSIIKSAILWIVVIVMIYPLLWMLLSSMRPEIEIFNSASRTGTYTFENYRKGWTGPTGVSFGRYYINSMIMVTFMIVGNLVACSLTAYALSRLKFTGSKVFFAIMLGTMMLPHHVVLIPRYIIFSRLGWVNTFLPMISPKWLATDGFFIFLMIQFMRTIPKDFDESASIDGCSTYIIFSRIVLPLCKPALITTIIFSFIWGWNDFLTQLLYLSRPDMMTVTLGLRLFVDSTAQSNWGALFAMSVLSLVPVFTIFITCQQYLVEGVMASGVKG
jgi:multiple sugar transport system permease protein